MAISEQEVFEFAKAPDPPPAVQEAVVETPPPETEVIETTVPEAPPPPTPEEVVPSWRLREEAEARRVAEDRARQFETRLAEVAAHLQQQQPKKNDFFENPDQATLSLVQRYIEPLAKEYRQGMMALGKSVASVAYGANVVDEAEQAFLKAHTAQTLDVMDYERVVQAPNRYDAVVQWHKRQNVLSSVGDDPAAWFEKQLEARLADPKFQATMLEKVRNGAGAKTGTTVKLPPSLSKSTAAAGNSPTEVAGDLSDASLFAHATKR